MNPIKSERDWPYFNVTTSKLPEQGDMTWMIKHKWSWL
jgi:hypothetical protein